MFEIVSIAAASATLAKLCGEVLLYIRRVKKVDVVIETVEKEINDLSEVLTNFHATIDVIKGDTIMRRTDRLHWKKVERVLNDCSVTLDDFAELVGKVRNTKLGIFGRTGRQFKLDWKSGDIALFRQRITSCRRVMDMSLNMIIVYCPVYLPSANGFGSIKVMEGGHHFRKLSTKLDAMNIKIDKYFHSHENDPLTRLPGSLGRTRSVHRRVMKNLRECALSTRDFHQVAESIVSKLENPTGASDTNSIADLTEQRRGDIEDWMKELAISSQVDPNEKVLLTSVTEVSTDLEDDDEAIELEVIQHQIQSATNKIKDSQFADAETLLRQVLMKSDEKYGNTYQWRESTYELLATACRGQSKWDEAKQILVEILEERVQANRGLQAIDTMHNLAEVYLATLDLENAISYGRKAVNGKSRTRGKKDPEFYRSVALLVRIFETAGDEASAEGYRPMLPPNYWNKQRQAIDQLGSMKPGEAADQAGATILGDLLPDDCMGKWSEIKENIRWRKEGICGSGWGYTLLHAIAEFGHEDAFQYLLETEPDVDIQDNSGNTPLHSAAKNHENIVRLLIEKKADIDATSDDGKTPLIVAAENGKHEIVLLLINNGANVHLKDEYEWTALHHAAFSGSDKSTRMLLQQGADVNIKGASERTPLHCAASRGHITVVRVLVNSNANVNAKSREPSKDARRALQRTESNRYTPLDLAKRYKHQHVIKFLQGNFY